MVLDCLGHRLAIGYKPVKGRWGSQRERNSSRHDNQSIEASLIIIIIRAYRQHGSPWLSLSLSLSLSVLIGYRSRQVLHTAPSVHTELVKFLLAIQPILLCPCVRNHWRMSPMIVSLLLPQGSDHVTLVNCEIGGKLPYNCCFMCAPYKICTQHKFFLPAFS